MQTTKNTENTEQTEQTEQEPALIEYSIKATPEDMRTIAYLFGEQIPLAFEQGTQEEKINASIAAMFSSSDAMMRIGSLMKVALPNPVIASKLYELAMVFAHVGSKLIKDDETNRDQPLTEDELKPILDLLSSIDIALPEELK